jgi:hypothetical protein
MIARLLKSLRSASFLTILVPILLSNVVVAQTGTAILRQRINQDLPSNNAKAITAAKLRSVFNASANAIDSIFTTFSLADGLGTYNASTGVATIKETGATFTPVAVANQTKGKYFDVVVAGTQSITGSSVSMVVGGRIISRGTKWEYLPATDLALQRTFSLENQVVDNAILEPAETTTSAFGVTTPINISASGTNRTRVDKTPIGLAGRLKELSVYATTGGSGKVKFLTKNLDDTYNLEKEFPYTFTTGLNAIDTTIFGSSFSIESTYHVGFYVASPASISGQDLNPAVQGVYYTGDISGTNNTATGSSTFALQYNLKVESVVVPAVSVKDAISDIKGQLAVGEAFDFEGGVTSPITGVASGANRTRMDLMYNVPYLPGTQVLKSMDVYCATAGTGKIKLVSKNSDGTYNVEKEVSSTFVVGKNTVTFPANFTVRPGWFFAFYAQTCSFGAILGDGPSFSLAVIPGELTGTNQAITNASNYYIQYKVLINTVNNAPLAARVASVSNTAFYVSKSGSDSNGCSVVAPCLTINKAIQQHAGNITSVVVNDGTYYETLDESAIVSGSLSIVAAQKAVVRVMGSQKLSGWVKTPGYTNIYEASFSGTIPEWNHPVGGLPNIFEDKNPSGAVTSTDFHALQKGLAYRLPYTKIPAVASGASLAATLTMMDGVPGRHYFSGGKIYIHASASTSPLTNGFDYHIPVRPSNTPPSASNVNAKADLYMENIQFWFSTAGHQASGFRLVERQNCSVFGVVDANGGWRDDAATVISYKDEAAGCSNDGFNQHFDAYQFDYSTQDVRRGVGVAFYFDPWAHDNMDDGMSCHARGEVSVYGGLSESNGDGGFVPANGGAYRVYNAMSRNNQLAADASQAGFGTANSSAGTGRNHTSLLAVNCISIGDKIGFQNNSESGSIVELWNPIAREASLFNYRVQTSGAIMNVNNGKSTNTNSARHKSIISGGVMNIVSDPALAP